MKNLLSLRKSHNLTQKEIAEHLGISRQAYANYETGTREPDINTILKIATFFDVSVDYLIGKEQEKKTSSKLISGCFTLTPHETAVISAYREQPEMQPAIDKLLGVIDDDTVTLYSAAYSKDNTPDEIITISKSEWERLKNLPFTDQEL